MNSPAKPEVVVCGAFDDLRSADFQFLEEAARLGPVKAWLWTDALVEKTTGRPPRFPQAERLYFLQSIRFVRRANLAATLTDPDALPSEGFSRGEVLWCLLPKQDTAVNRTFCAREGIARWVIDPRNLALPAALEVTGCSEPAGAAPPSGRKKVIVTGCYDWLHSGHVRFFEEVSTYGDLYVVLGRDENIRLLKGEGHPLIPQAERRYMVAAIRFVKAALFGTGQGWLDAEPEVDLLRPDIYAVNDDGDKGGKREFCLRRGLEYLVLRREPAPGLARRSSTDLRGF